MGEKSWKNSATIPILKLLYESEVAISPGGITLNLKMRLERPPSRSTVTRAIDGLQGQQYVRKPDPEKSYYLITEEGRTYIEKTLND